MGDTSHQPMVNIFIEAHVVSSQIHNLRWWDRLLIMALFWYNDIVLLFVLWDSCTLLVLTSIWLLNRGTVDHIISHACPSQPWLILFITPCLGSSILVHGTKATSLSPSFSHLNSLFPFPPNSLPLSLHALITLPISVFVRFEVWSWLVKSMTNWIVLHPHGSYCVFSDRFMSKVTFVICSLES